MTAGVRVIQTAIRVLLDQTGGVPTVFCHAGLLTASLVCWHLILLWALPLLCVASQSHCGVGQTALTDFAHSSGIRLSEPQVR
jgi:hypothetical protein